MRRIRHRLVHHDPLDPLRPGRPFFTFGIAGALVWILWSVYSTPALSAAQIALFEGFDVGGDFEVPPAAEVFANLLPPLSLAGQDAVWAPEPSPGEVPTPAETATAVSRAAEKEGRATPAQTLPRRPSTSPSGRTTAAPSGNDGGGSRLAAAPIPSDSPNCLGFDWQEDAQARFEQDRSDPWGLDGPAGSAFAGRAGVACEGLPRQAAQPAPGPVPQAPTPSAAPTARTSSASARATVPSLIPTPLPTPIATPTPRPTATPTTTPTATPTPTSSPSAEPSEPVTGGSGAHVPDQYSCTDFTTQAEAQTLLDADPSDPHFLDDDDDGIACNDLLPGYWDTGDAAFLSDLRAATPTREELVTVDPGRARYGVFTEHAFVTERGVDELDSFVSAAGKHPDTVLVFQQWNLDGGFPRGLVIEAWRRGMLPIITWEPIVVDGGDQWAPELDEIRRGDYDEYLARWSQEAADLGLPFGLRFAHELNGDWYPWSEEVAGNEAGDYAATWRYVHERLSPTRDQAMWIWSPNLVHSRPDIDLGPLYPGDDVVDWVGTSGYYRRVDGQPSFAKTFGSTIDQLRRVAGGKPILLAEIGADADDTDKKTEWIESLFSGLAEPEYADVMGFVWFNMDKSDPDSSDPDDVHRDWRIEQSEESAAAFRDGVATGPTAGRYGAGHPIE